MTQILHIPLRIPKGLWDDLEASVIQQDRQFLTEVAKTLGLPVQDVLKKCLGPTTTNVPVLWMHRSDAGDACPWWTRFGTLWKPCQRSRLSPTQPCCIHERPTSQHMLQKDERLQSLSSRIPVKRKGILYWVDPDGIAPPLHEDGSVEKDGNFQFVQFKGKQIAIWKHVP
jgi:hypothetical protein